MEERIVELEVRAAYQERLIGELDEVVRAFAERVEQVERELRELKDTVAVGGEPVGGADEPPPHY